MAEKYVRVRLARSLIGCNDRQKRTVQALGLKKVDDVAIHQATPAIVGMCRKVSHVVDWKEVNGADVETA